MATATEVKAHQQTLKDELAINDALGRVARTMLETVRGCVNEVEFAEIKAELDRLEQRQRDRRQLLEVAGDAFLEDALGEADA